MNRQWQYDYRYDHENPMSLDGLPIKKPDGTTNEMVIVFYLVGCQHDYRGMSKSEASSHGITLLSHDHSSICEKCDHIITVNSSD